MQTARILRRFLTTSVLALVFTGSALAQDEDGGTLTVRLPTDVRNLDPAHWFSEYDKQVAMPLYDGLIRYIPGTYETELVLAESLEVSDDGTRIDFTLRQGVQCHAGYGELTANDVKYSFERFLDTDYPSPYVDDWRPLQGVEVTGDYEGTIVLDKAFAPLFNSTLPMMSGSIVCEEAVADLGVEAFAMNPVGTGPYLFDSWNPNRDITLVRNADYWGEQPYFDEIRFVIIPDEQSAELALRAGEVDFSLLQLSALSLLERDPNIETTTYPGLSYRWIGMNVEHPKLEDVRVREALRLAIDVPSILIVAYEGLAEQSHALVAEGLTGHWENAGQFSQDLEAARQLIEEAGAEGLQLRLDIADTSEYRAWAQIAQQNFRQIGVELTINTMDTGSFWEIGSGSEGENVELFAMSFAMEPDPAWATMWFTCDQVGIWNWMRWCNEEYDELHARGLETIDEDERHQIYIRMQELMEEDAVAIWLIHGVMPYGWQPHIVPAQTPHGSPLFAHFEGL